MSAATILVDNLDRYHKQANRDRGLFDVEVKCSDCGRVLMLFVADEGRDGWRPFQSPGGNKTVQGRRVQRRVERGGGLNYTLHCHARCSAAPRSVRRSSLLAQLDRARSLGQHAAYLT